MTDVILGPAGSAVQVDLDVCAKTGRTTDQQVTLRGSTTPGWVTVLLLFTVVGFLLARAMTSRRYSITLPLDHAVFVRWKRNSLLAWVVGLTGVVALAVAAASQGTPSALWGGVGLVLVTAALVGGTVSSVRHGLGARTTREGDLVLTRAHDAFARAVDEAAVESTSRWPTRTSRTAR